MDKKPTFASWLGAVVAVGILAFLLIVIVLPLAIPFIVATLAIVGLVVVLGKML